MENRPTFVMRGTGRLADEITLTGKVVAVDISRKPDEILEILKEELFIRQPAMLVLVWMTDFFPHAVISGFAGAPIQWANVNVLVGY